MTAALANSKSYVTGHRRMVHSSLSPYAHSKDFIHFDSVPKASVSLGHADDQAKQDETHLLKLGPEGHRS